jgi:hypothetical protein
MDEHEHKRCRVCGEVKSLERFSRHPHTRDRRSSKCKQCAAQYARERYERARRKRSPRNYTKALTAEQWSAVRRAGVLRCRSCLEDRPLNQFRKRIVNGREYYRRECRVCELESQARWRQENRRHIARYSKRYRCKQRGITTEEYDRLVEQQNGLCAICGRPLGERGQTIDHDHETGAVRGIVHSSCNLVIGNAGDDTRVLSGAIRYLARRKGSETPPECLIGQVVRLEVVA